MPLTRITVTGYKSIEHAEVELRALNVLIGANGAGKSNFVAVFELLREVVEGRLGAYVARRGGGDVLLRFGRKHTDALTLEFGVSGPRRSWVVTTSPADPHPAGVRCPRIAAICPGSKGANHSPSDCCRERNMSTM
jgi:predicted ATPase